jgi:ribokinase
MAMTMSSFSQANVRYIGQVGNDVFGTFVLKQTAHSQLNSPFFAHSLSEPTGIGHVRKFPDGQYDTVVFEGANRTLSAEVVEQGLASFGNADWIVTNLESPLAVVAQVAARYPQIKLALNLSPLTSETAIAMDVADLLVLNEGEARYLASHVSGSDIEAVLEYLVAESGAIVVITLGELGAIGLLPDGELVRVPAKKAQVISTLGAGDTFFGAFMHAFTSGKSLEKSMSFAALAGSLVCERSYNSLSPEDAKLLPAI